MEMKNFMKEAGSKIKSKLKECFILLEKYSTTLYLFILNNIKWLIFISAVLSFVFSVIKTLLFNGYSVDSYQYYALSIEKLLITGKQDYLFVEYYARNRIIYPLIVALIHLIVPIDISILACLVNTFFAFASLFVVRKILKFKQFESTKVDLFTLLTIVSYNFLNYLFINLTDFVGLFFFLLTCLFLIRFISTNNYFDLSFSLIFYIYSVLARESYMIAIILYIFSIKNRKIRFSTICIFLLLIIILLFFPERIPFRDKWLTPSYRDFFLNKEYWKLLLLILQKWANPTFVLRFLKGLFKVGIFTSFIFTLFLKKDFFKMLFKNLIAKKVNIFIVWFLVYFIFYSVIYSHPASASGLRYWLPISFIPTIFVSKYLVQSKQNNIIKLIILLLLIFTPPLWSIGELYINRNSPSGTGPIINAGFYFNDMTDTRSISSYNPEIISITTINKTFLNTTLNLNQTNPDPEQMIQASFSIYLWLNITSNATLILKMRVKDTQNVSYWRLQMYEAYPNFYAGFGELVYELNNQQTYGDFHIYTFFIDKSFLLRKITFLLTGYTYQQFIWDFLLIDAT